MPIIKSDIFGYQLHPIDLAANKVLAFAGRDEPRDILDTLYIHKEVLELGPLSEKIRDFPHCRNRIILSP